MYTNADAVMQFSTATGNQDLFRVYYSSSLSSECAISLEKIEKIKVERKHVRKIEMKRHFVADEKSRGES